MDNFVDLLDELEKKCDFRHYGDRWRSFILESCKTIAHRMSPETVSWLNMGERFKKGLVSSGELEAARIAAWKAWDSIDPEFHKRYTVNGNTIRAVICALYPEDNKDDWFKTISHFIASVNAVEPHEREQIDLLRKLFRDVLEEPKKS